MSNGVAHTAPTAGPVLLQQMLQEGCSDPSLAASQPGSFALVLGVQGTEDMQKVRNKLKNPLFQQNSLFQFKMPLNLPPPWGMYLCLVQKLLEHWHGGISLLKSVSCINPFVQQYAHSLTLSNPQTTFGVGRCRAGLKSCSKNPSSSSAT